MPRAKRYYLPRQVWHITHRCHKKEHLLKFARDRQEWIKWLFQAKKRYGLRVLDYMVTSNHIHLLVVDDGKRDTIPRSLQLIAGRTGQQYNERKKRNGAFWEDRYHATAVESDRHLIQCIVYIDLNMVRAGAVTHPSEWIFSGYNQIQKPRQRYTLIDYRRLMELMHVGSTDDLRESHKKWVEKSLRSENHFRESKWTGSIAVGSKQFVEKIKQQLGFRARGRKIVETEDEFQLQETMKPYPYSDDFTPKNDHLKVDNSYYWKVYQ